MTPRPKKKNMDNSGFPDVNENFITRGYNECYNEFENFLPSEEEIKEILLGIPEEHWNKYHRAGNIAKALHKRLRG